MAKSLEKTASEFIEALHAGKPLTIDSHHCWHVLSITDRLLLGGNSYLKVLCQKLVAQFDELEATPVLFSPKGEQLVNFNSYMQIGYALKTYMEEHNPLASDLIDLLEIRLIALKYRLEKINGGEDQTFGPSTLFGRLLFYAEQWKRKNPLFWSKELTQFDYSRLTEARSYEDFVALLIQKPRLRDQFFSWILRDGISAAPYIQYPALCQTLIDSNLNGRIGRIGNEYLKIVKYPYGYETMSLQKLVTLPFEGGDVNILDKEGEVLLSGNYHLKIKDIFDMFAHKEATPGNVEFFALGITNWNTHCLGWWNAHSKRYELTDMDQPDWWLQMPITEILTLQEARRRYGMHLDGKQWVAIAQACRQYLNMNYEKTHAYLEVAIPLGNGGYSIYDFGKFATTFPFSLWSRSTFAVITHAATIAYPDENLYLTRRQHLGFAFDLSPDQGIILMDAIRQDILAARQGHIVYQLAVDNCGRWIQERLGDALGSDKIPNLFRTNLIEAEPTGIAGFCYRWIKCLLPKKLHSKMLSWILFPFGAWKGKWTVDKAGQRKWVSMLSSSYWEDGIVYMPSFLHKQMETGSIEAIPETAEQARDADQGLYTHWDSHHSKWINHW